MKSENYIRETVAIFFMQKGTILWTTFLVTLAAILIAFLYPPVYKVTGSVVIQGGKLNKRPDAIEEAETRVQGINTQDLLSELEILNSPALGRHVMARLDDVRDEKSLPSNDVLSKIIESRIVEIAPGSTIIKVSMTSKNQQALTVVLNSFLDEYIYFRGTIFVPEQAQSFFQGQADRYEHDIYDNEQELLDIIKKAETADPSAEIANNMQTKLALQKDLTDLEDQRIELENEVLHLHNWINQKDAVFFSSIDNYTISTFSEKLQSLYIEYGELQRVYTEDSTKIIRIKEQIKNTLNALRKEATMYTDLKEKQLKSIDEKIAYTKSLLDNIQERNGQLKDFQYQFERVERRLQVLKGSFTTFFTRNEEAKINSSDTVDDLFDVRILSRPGVPQDPYYPRKEVVIPLGLFIGFILGCSLGFIKEYFDHTIKRPEDVHQYVEVPVVLSIPQ